MNIKDYGKLIKTLTLKERSELNKKIRDEKRAKQNDNTRI